MESEDARALSRVIKKCSFIVPLTATSIAAADDDDDDVSTCSLQVRD